MDLEESLYDRISNAIFPIAIDFPLLGIILILAVLVGIAFLTISLLVQIFEYLKFYIMGI
ncbi:hypothetical protein M501DRAFT_995004 [Patellaria atrata CBS 101060]|uniref:Uncharacterized protein n=1 Tax=Patellaria atrata CBS 101060 TaxID=1346257 RepID=A0A9P4S8D3_9PEZI|nr:hypothetical protein M501DRAFT_995004 [Patellaria atrata CBS 101060]